MGKIKENVEHNLKNIYHIIFYCNMNQTNSSQAPSPAPTQNDSYVPSPATTGSAPSPATTGSTPSPVTTVAPYVPSPATTGSAPSPVTTVAPFAPSPVVPSPATTGSAPSPVTTVAPYVPSPVTTAIPALTPSPYVQTAEEVALQQFLLALAASLLCLFLMFRNKERIMKRTFQKRHYMNIHDSGSDEDEKQLVELPEIDDINYIEESTDNETDIPDNEV